MKKNTDKNIKENLKSMAIIALGNLLLTSAYAFLTVPNNIINGGVTSTSLLLSHYLNIDIGYISSVITIFLLLFGRVALGKDFFYRSLFSSVCYMVFFNFLHFTGISFFFRPLIIVLFAGIFVGVGHYLCLREDSSTVGYDVFALFIHKKNKKLDTAIVLRIIGICVLIVGVATFGIKSVIYGIIFTIIQTQVIYLLNKSHEVNAKILKATH